MNTTSRLCRSSSTRIYYNTNVVVTLVATLVGCQVSRPKSEYEANNEVKKHHDDDEAIISSLQHLSPTLPIYIFHPNPNLEIAFDTRTRNPLYVLEHIIPAPPKNHLATNHDNTTNNAVVVKLKRPNNFYEEKSLPEEFRSRVSHYRNSGYDRGHLAAAINYMHTTQQHLVDTFNLINISPQHHVMNATLWAELERWIQTVAQDNHRQQYDTYVVTGPLWMPVQQISERQFDYRYSAIGIPPSLVSVPTHFYKIVIAVTTNNNHHPKKIVKFACFVIPNQDLTLVSKTQQQRRHVLADFLVPWTALEAVTGLHFFPALIAPNSGGVEWKETANQLTMDIVMTNKKKQQSEQQPNHHPLLLTDGSTSTTSDKKKWGFGSRNKKQPDLVHFCANGSCS